MILYLLRHGETESNAENIHQSLDTPLSVRGIRQSNEAIHKLKDRDIDIIITSPLPRAKDTATILSDTLHISMIENNYLREKQNPSIIIGRKKYDTDVLQIKKEIEKNYHNPNWKHSDEESYFDLHKRVNTVITWITQSSYRNPLIVTHEVIIKMFTASILFGPNLNSHLFWDFYSHIHIANCSLTICRFENGWKLEMLGSV